jgi:hypothetical protein
VSVGVSPHFRLLQIRWSRAEHHQIPLHGRRKGTSHLTSQQHPSPSPSRLPFTAPLMFPLHVRSPLLQTGGPKSEFAGQSAPPLACSLLKCREGLTRSQAMFNLANNLKASGRNADAVEMYVGVFNEPE